MTADAEKMPADTDQAHEPKAERPAPPRARAEKMPAAASVAAKPEPCPCQAEGAVTLEDIDARIQAVGRLVLVVAVAAAVAYLFAGREQLAGGRDG